MAMAERPRPGWASYHNPNTNNCQDLGNSILLLLGLIICINISINMVTLLWSRLRGILHRVFHHIVCEKEAPKPSSPGKQTQPSKKKSSPAVHLRCTMDPVKMTVTPPSTRRHRHQGSLPHRAHHPVAWAPNSDDEMTRHPHPEICSHHWNGPEDWEAIQPTQEIWASWMRDALEPPPQTIRFQSTGEGRPLKTEFQSEQGLEAYVYPVNPPPPSPETLSHNSGAGAAQCQPAPPPVLGPAVIPEIPRRRSSGRIMYDARDVRRRLRELTREVEALSHCYPLASASSTAEGTGKDWVYRPLTGR
ncbi:spermatid maturation protein 1 [Cynocephalus volans]|uniref:spermatid maturation protein 1 n=1 Tax=Cynocephalus volans TaxID=110931 RepID=UPI002FC89085